jgi:hypothetical protein
MYIYIYIYVYIYVGIGSYKLQALQGLLVRFTARRIIVTVETDEELLIVHRYHIFYVYISIYIRMFMYIYIYIYAYIRIYISISIYHCGY